MKRLVILGAGTAGTIVANRMRIDAVISAMDFFDKAAGALVIFI